MDLVEGSGVCGNIGGGAGGEGGDLVERGAGEGGGEVAGVDEESFEFGGSGEGLGGELVWGLLPNWRMRGGCRRGWRLFGVEGEVYGLGLVGMGFLDSPGSTVRLSNLGHPNLLV